MKKLLLIVTILVVSVRTYAQNPALLLSTKTMDAQELPLDSVEYIYTKQSVLTGAVRSVYSSSSQSWRSYWKKTYVIDQNGMITSETTWLPDGNNWLEWKKVESTYDQNSRLTSVDNFDWTNGTWLKSSSTALYYSGNDVLDSTKTVKFDAQGNSSPSERQLFSYDQEGLMTEALNESWNAGQNAYTSVSRDLYNYNLDKKLLREDHESFIGYWYGSHFFYYYYTSFGEIDRRVRYVTSTGQIYDTRYYRYNQQDPAGAFTQENVAMVQIYPNPFNETFTFDLTGGTYSFELIDLTGKVVAAEENLTGHVHMELRDLNEGVYFYRIADNEGRTSSGKLIKH